MTEHNRHWPGYNSRPGRLSEADINRTLAEKADDEARIARVLGRHRQAAFGGAIGIGPLADQVRAALDPQHEPMQGPAQWHDGAPIAAEAANDVGEQFDSADRECVGMLVRWIVALLVLVGTFAALAEWGPAIVGVVRDLIDNR